MILVDTSIWVEHLNRGSRVLSRHLEEQSVLIHPFVIGEIALGSLRDRKGVLALLTALPTSSVADDSEVLRFIEDRKAHGTGIGYVDAHLLAATALTTGAKLWTRDKKLQDIATHLGLSASL